METLIGRVNVVAKCTKENKTLASGDILNEPCVQSLDESWGGKDWEYHQV